MFDLATHATAIDPDKMLYESGDVFAAFAQGWQHYRKYVQAVIEVAAEFTAVRHVGKITVCGGNQANVNFVGASAAQAFEFLLLQNAQQLGL
jgi:hypothetical protein